MLVIALELVKQGSTIELQTWLDEHRTAIIDRMLLSGNFCYIFYEEPV